MDSAAYIKADNVNITASGTDKRTTIKAGECPNYAYFGGLVGATANSNGVLIDLGNFTLNTNNEYFCGGGVVGQFYNGVLRLSGTTDMTGAKPEGSYTTDNNTAMRFASYGQLVGTNDNVLVYALGNGNDNGWTFKRSNGAVSDDLGTWGEVVRIPNIEKDVLTYSDTEHTVTVKSAVSSIGTPADFVTTALNIQLNNIDSSNYNDRKYDCLLFEDTSSSTRDTLLASTITLTADIKLSGTGVNGFMRDGCVVNADNDKPVSQITKDKIGGTSSFTGTLKGNSHTVTLAIGESYGVFDSNQTEGTGQIYRHQYNGLFSVVGNGTDTLATIQGLTIDGTINVRNAGPDGMFIGGIAARSHGSVTLNSITANEAIYYHEGARSPVDTNKNLGKNIGGFIGYVSGSGTTLTVTGTSEASPAITLRGYHMDWNVYGGVIGKVVSDSFTINIAQGASDSLTVKMTSDVSGVTNVGSNSDCGGLIGIIISTGSYGNRKVNIKNLVFDGCTVANASYQNGGGFLGFSWLNTTAQIDGVEVIGKSQIVNKDGVKDVGVMCYNATGKWTVDSLIISSMTVNNGASSSLGMIVNKAYNENNGLYLDVLNSGYTLTKDDITLPATIGVFDEIAAYSASDVINGRNTTNNEKGAGVISIDMNSNRSGTAVKITDTGTYQNQISNKSEKFANPKSRYYYNLNHIDISDGGQNLLKWSVSKYAASNIKDEFTATGNPLGTTGDNETNADLTGLSFYPVPVAEDSTIYNLNVMFDYEAINTLEASMGSDSYARDPGEENQHYLMQSGLFLNVNEGKTLKISGKLTLNGNFLSADEYKGVLISDTMKGSLDCSSGSILLNGIKPSTPESYLLINNITRDSTTSSPLSMKLSNVSTGKGYTTGDTTPQIAKSLIGAVSGPGLNIEFLKIKLDARISNDSISGASTKQITALDTAYKTKNSIFTDATLLESIKSDDTSVLVYNYTFDEDWGTGSRNVTYGKEITSSVEYKGLEKQYYGDKRYYTNPLTAPDENSGEFDFSTVFLKYVSAAYDSNKDANGLYSRELKVNVMTLALNVGCGTYNDPYIITNGKQLEAVSKFINGGNTSDLSKVNLPKKSDDFDNLAENTTGSRWCSDKSGNDYHAEYVPNSGATGYASTATGASEWTAVNVQYYLANAYYKIAGNIEVIDFLGLGGTSANTAFRGVIVGEKNEDGTPKYTITNKSEKPFINVSNGCVVKDINIVVDKDIALSQVTSGSANAAFGYVSKCSYYGGVIGEVMGGDNIIDNCYVTFGADKKVTLSGDYGMLCPVGSYVGVVVFGAVIFKNMDSVKANTNASALKVYYGTDTTNLTAEASKGAIYVNPLVGRVINGYAVNETTQFSVTENNKYHDDEGTYRAGKQHSLKNTTKHYTIADINKNEENKLNVSKVPTSTTADGEINIPNSQAMFVLSLITQSLAGTANTADRGYLNSLSYGTNGTNPTTVYGMSRGADYDNIGTNETSVSDYSDYVNMYDTAANTAVPYIISRYTNTTNGYTARCLTSTKGYYNINLENDIAYALPDSFRGIGSVGRMNNKENSQINELYYTFKLNILNGQNCDIDVDMYINRYYNRIDNYFDYLHHSTYQLNQQSGNTVDFDNDAKYKANGFGLFDTVIMKDINSSIKEFNISGSVNVESYKYNNLKPDGEEDKAHHDSDYKNVMWLSVGGVCGWSRNDHYVMFEKINLNNLSVRGPCKIAGLLGESGISSTTFYVSVKECNANNLSLELTNGASNDNASYRNSIGGFVGKVKEGKVIVDGGEAGKTVKLKKFSILSSGGQGYTSGGLVAYAGNGCEASNMTVCPVDRMDSVNIGNFGSGMSGGIVALMQPKTRYSNECIASFENCEVKNINVYGGCYAGGFYGGTWNTGQDGWVPYQITIDNCKVTGNSAEKNEIKAKACAGGFVADGLVYSDNKPNIEIKNSFISNYNILKTDNDKKISGAVEGNGVGGFIGFADAQKTGASVTCYIHDCAVENCTIGSNIGSAGGVIGQIVNNTANTVLGYNIKLNKVTSDSANMGAWVGYMDTKDTSTSIQFTGMAIYGNGFDKNIGNWSTDQNKSNTKTSFVFADYLGKCNDTDSAKYAKESGLNYNADTHVKMPFYPYVNVYPQSPMGTNEVISGDGAVLSNTSPVNTNATGSNTIAAKILADIDDTSNPRRYTTFSDDAISGDKKIGDYLKQSVDDDCNRISTYKTETGNLPDGVDDFAVIVVSKSDEDETTNLLNRYIQLVTNTATDYSKKSSYYEISLNSCEYKDGKFQIAEDNTGCSLTKKPVKDVNGDIIGYEYQLNTDKADSLKQNTFTLVDVQFKDPLNTDKIAYHLYVPVYTVKQMTYSFEASAMKDTKSVSYPHEAPSDYKNSFGKFHIDNLNTWVTQYVRFTYSVTDMNILLASGDLNWNHDKYFVLNTQQASCRLPIGTKMILVDPNGPFDRTYYANLNESVFESTKSTIANAENLDSWRIDLDRFTKNGTSDGVQFKVNNFSDILSKYIIAEVDANGAYADVTDQVTANPDAQYTIYDSTKNKYYLYTTDGSGEYNLTVNEKVNEDYYISFYAPNPQLYDYELYYYTISKPDKLTGKRSAVPDETGNKECSVLIADLFAQEQIEYSVKPDNEKINVESAEITVKAKSLITLKNSTAKSYLIGKSLYHAFHILLNRHEADGSINNTIIGLNNEDVTAAYSIEYSVTENDVPTPKNVSGNCIIDLKSDYLNAETTNFLEYILAADGLSITVSAEIQMQFYDTEEFPEKISEGDIGVNVAASSNLAYEQERLSYTSMSTAFSPDRKYYYRESATAAHLSYSAVSELDEYDIHGKNSRNFSRLGVNGFSSIGKYGDRTAMEIHSRAVFNVASVEEQYFDQATSVRFSMTLWKKADTKAEDGTITSAAYEQVDDISKYLLGVKFMNIDTTMPRNIDKSDKKTYVYDLTIEGCNELGPRIYPADIVYYAITGDGFTEYANYKVQIQAELLNAEGKTIGNQPKDYIVYTNAKVFPTVINQADLNDN
ncbi:MAG: hypothetical protein ACI4J2_08975 [Ruminococcus sp.]